MNDNQYHKGWVSRNWRKKPKQKCLHEGCPACNGTGRKANGTTCVHMISCPCPKCTPR